MSEMPRVWWDGNDFLYLLPGPLLGVEGYGNVRRPGLYRARKAADIPAEGVVELAPVSDAPAAPEETNFAQLSEEKHHV